MKPSKLLSQQYTDSSPSRSFVILISLVWMSSGLGRPLSSATSSRQAYAMSSGICPSSTMIL